VRSDGIYVGLVEIGDPGNLGTVIRTMDAVGTAGLILVGHTVDPYHPTAVKASMGALFSSPHCHVDAVDDLLKWTSEMGIQTVATSAKAELSFWQAKPRFPVCLILGSEGQGLPQEVFETADLSVTIPMTGQATSLNLAVAAGILLFEMRRPGTK
jgi:TrmH family RNA methyltransferase